MVATLANLCLDLASGGRILSDNGLKTLAQIATRATHNSTLELVAFAFFSLSVVESNCSSLVSKYAISHISKLSMSTASEVVNERCVLAQCNLLVVGTAASEILRFGAISNLVTLCHKSEPRLHSACALALWHLVRSDVAEEALASRTILPCVVQVCRDTSSVLTKCRCVASVCLVAQSPKLCKYVMSEGPIIECLVEILTSDMMTFSTEGTCVCVCGLMTIIVLLNIQHVFEYSACF